MYTSTAHSSASAQVCIEARERRMMDAALPVGCDQEAAGAPSPGADVARGEPSPGADAEQGGPSPGAALSIGSTRHASVVGPRATGVRPARMRCSSRGCAGPVPCVMLLHGRRTWLRQVYVVLTDSTEARSNSSAAPRRQCVLDARS